MAVSSPSTMFASLDQEIPLFVQCLGNDIVHVISTYFPHHGLFYTNSINIARILTCTHSLDIAWSHVGSI
mgnify:CR=1 FL=1